MKKHPTIILIIVIGVFVFGYVYKQEVNIKNNEEALNNADAGISESGSKWIKYEDNPVLYPTEDWEKDSVLEPTVLYEDRIFKMWYTGGVCAVGYATSTDGIIWDKYKNNPTLWHGDETQKNLKKSMGKKHTAMLKALIAKFTQDKKLEDLLLKTGDQLIIEDTAQANGFQDSEWGAGDDYKGRNILGQMLMWLRKELRDGKKADEIDPKKFVRVIDPKDYLAVYEELMGKTVPTEKKSANRTEFADFAEALSLVPSMP